VPAAGGAAIEWRRRVPVYAYKGVSQSGKTTLVKVLLGLVRASSGEARHTRAASRELGASER